jgi:hypothetical protein
MARIRTIKPEFFTSDDICALSPLARLLYIGLWCEADREGRLVWVPRVFKRRYLPDDACDGEAVAGELIGRGLVVLYGEGLACIPTFARHQHLNPREAASKLPPADASPRVDEGSPDPCDAQGGREGKEEEERKGKERKREGTDDAPARASRRPHTIAHALPGDWRPGADDLAWASTARPDLGPEALAVETERFRNHAAANGRTARCWGPYWRNWITRAFAPKPDAARASGGRTGAGGVVADRDSEAHWRARLRGYRPGGFWLEGDWGARPESGHSRVPAPILAEWRASRETGGGE